MDRWCGRVAIVTGASAGIGAAIARLLVENGMKVVGVARRSEKIKSLAAELKGCKGELHAVEGDVTKEEDVVRIVKWTRDHLGGAHVLVNNAGVYNEMPLSAINSSKLREAYDTNVVALCLCTSEVIKDMRDRGLDDGHIFHIGSAYGQRIVNVPGSYAHQGTKHAVRVMTEGLRRELRDLKTKIRVTEISPGAVRTNIVVSSGRMTEAEAKIHYDKNPSLEPSDIAEALKYALSTPPHVQIHEITIQPLGQVA